MLFTTGDGQEAQLPVNLDFVAVNIEAEDFGTEFEFTFSTRMWPQHRILLRWDLPFKASDHVDAERTETDISDGATDHSRTLDLVLSRFAWGVDYICTPKTQAWRIINQPSSASAPTRAKRLSNRYYHKTMRNALRKYRATTDAKELEDQLPRWRR